MNRSLLAVLALASLVVLSACSSGPIQLYEGAARPSSELAVVTLPEQLEVASVNGVEVKNAAGMLRSGSKTLELLPGRYQLLVFYREIWELPGQHEVLRSNPALFALNAEAGHHYSIDFQRPKTYEQAQALTAAFAGWSRDDSTGVQTASSDSHLKFREGVVAQVTGNLDLVASTQTNDQARAQQAVAPLTASVAAATPVAAAAATARPAVATASDWLLLMQASWKQGSPEERRSFLRWLSEQP